MNIKLKRKLERQARKTEALMTGYSVKGKSSTTRRSHSRGNLWNHHNEPIKADIDIWYK